MHKVEPYPCPFCWKWHVGRRTSNKRLRYLVALRKIDAALPQDRDEEVTT